MTSINLTREEADQRSRMIEVDPVSYTHLTLPTKA